MESVLGITRKVDITFHRGGRINISAHASRLLSLTHGDVIDMYVAGGELYLFVKYRSPVVGRHEGMVFRSNKNGNHCVASSIRLCRFMFSFCEVTDSTDKLRLCVGETEQKRLYGTVLPILYKRLL